MMDATRAVEGQVVVVTGGGSGIGKATALRFAGAGARVAICGRNGEKLGAVAKEANGQGEVLSMVADISKPEDIERLYNAVESRWGRLDVLFAHAGINGVWAPMDEMSVEEWTKTININLLGTFHTVKFALPMLKRSKGSIVITSSINGHVKFSDLGSTAYSASKAGELAFMKLAALELAEHGVRVNAVCPGTIKTHVEDNMEKRDTKASGEYAEYPRGAVPLTGGKPGKPEQVAELVMYLASAQASHITGAAVVVDGGQSLIQG